MSPTCTASDDTTLPPSASKLCVTTFTSPSPYGLPSWIVAMLRTPSTS
ncbi:MAG: hypothetical protein U0703_05035 [Anaerolineae bacterium]